MARRNQWEDIEARAYWQWAQFVPLLREHLYHIPNGGYRSRIEAAIMKAMGVRAGVSDYHLPIERGGFLGLWIEMKAKPPHDARVTEDQAWWGDKMLAEGHAFFVCRGFEEARAATEWYLSLPQTLLVPEIEIPDVKELVNAA